MRYRAITGRMSTFRPGFVSEFQYLLDMELIGLQKGMYLIELTGSQTSRGKLVIE